MLERDRGYWRVPERDRECRRGTEGANAEEEWRVQRGMEGARGLEMEGAGECQRGMEGAGEGWSMPERNGGEQSFTYRVSQKFVDRQ